MVKRTETVVKEETERDFTVYADKEPTGTMSAFADWLIDEVALEFANPKLEAAFRDGVRLGGTLRMEFQASEYWREDERNPRSPAGKAARAAANGAEKETTAKPARRGRAATRNTEAVEDEAPAKPARRGRPAAAAKPAARSGRRGKPASEPQGEGTEAPY